MPYKSELAIVAVVVLVALAIAHLTLDGGLRGPRRPPPPPPGSWAVMAMDDPALRTAALQAIVDCTNEDLAALGCPAEGGCGASDVYWILRHRDGLRQETRACMARRGFVLVTRR